jgi:hypothetical protein
MPFKSKKQQAYLWAKEPAIAKKWTKEHGALKRGGRVVKNKGGTMPTVGTKKFSYTPAGKKSAASYAKTTGQSVSKAYKKGGKVKMRKGGSAKK